MKKEMTCIVCPRGCHLIIDENNNVTGNSCPRGKEYAISEITRPMRSVTTTIRVINRDHEVVSVKTDKNIDKDKMMDVIALANSLSVEAPCHVGDIVASNILGSDVNLVITKNID